MSTLSSGNDSSPNLPNDLSRGSSVSSTFQNEYEEILKYAIVAPKIHIEKDVYSNPTTSEETSASSNLSNSIQNAYNVPHKSTQKKEKSVQFLSTPKTALDTLLENTSKTPAKSSVVHPPSSVDSTPESESFQQVQSPSAVDKDMIRMESLMDDWLLQLKRNVMTELGDMRLRQVQSEEKVARELRAQHNAETMRMNHEIQSLKELLFTFEQSVKQKDEVIKNLTDTLHKQKEKCDKIRLFSMWRLKHNDEQRQGFSAKMADKYYNRMLSAKVWISWRSVVESKWKERVEKACKIKSQEVCLKLTEDYEERLQGVHDELKAAREEVSKLHTERDHYEENMKKAFMRGVCALNMEALSMFKEGASEDTENDRHDVHPSCMPPSEYHNDGNITYPKTSKQTSSQKQVSFATDGVENVRSTNTSNNTARVTSNRKNLNLKMTGKRELSRKNTTGLGKPSTISSVKVERHLPLESDRMYANTLNQRAATQKSVGKT